MQPCKVCGNFEEEKISPEDNGRSVLSNDFSTSVSAGCPGCRLLSKVSEYCWGTSLYSKDADASLEFYLGFKEQDVQAEKRVYSPTAPTTVRKYRWETMEGHVWWDFDVLRLPDSQLLQNRLLRGKKTSGYTASKHSFDDIVRWIRSCENQHQQCKAKSNSRLPKRVLRLWTNGQPCVKLVEDSELTEPYACLSHCWGKSRPLITTASSLEQFKDEIRLESLPLTFRHAIEVTRMLGLTYLWIDSLCILQDCESDWKLQAANMANIFESAFITIAGTAGKDSNSGLYSSNPEYDLSATSRDGSSYRVFARQRIKHFDLLNPYVFDEDRESDNWFHPSGFPKLLERGWVYQERLLSRRVLHFGQELYWECMEDAWCQCWERASEPDDYADLRILPKVNHAALFKEPDPRSAAIRWRQIVSEYSGLKLTFPSDRLPAIAGMATQLGRIRPNCYIATAGLWNDSLSEDLLWHTLGIGLSGRLQRGRAPSWSWASIGNKVVYPQAAYQESESDTRLHKAFTLKAIGTAPSDTVTDSHHAVLSVRGQLCVAGLSYSIENNGDPDNDDPTSADGGETSEGEEVSEISWVVSPGGYYVRDFAADYDLARPGPYQAPSGSKIYCFKIAFSKVEYFAMVLRRLENGFYERIGLLQQNLAEEPGARAFWDAAKETELSIV